MNLHNLKTLKLNQNRIENSIRLSRHALAAPPPPENEAWSSLEVLQLAHNRVADVRDLLLVRYPHLRELTLQSNLLCHATGLGFCQELKDVDLSKNRIRQFAASGTAGLSSLRELRMEEAGLRSLLNLAPLTSLTHLYLAFNRINDVGELEKLSNVGRITEISMSNNPVARKQLYRPTLIYQIPTICLIDGRQVLEEERDRADIYLQMERPLNFFLHEVRPTCAEANPTQTAPHISAMNMSGNFAIGDLGAPSQRVTHRSDSTRQLLSTTRRSSFMPQRA